MKRRALVAFTLLALGLAPACASDTAPPPDVPLAVAAESAPANTLSPKTVGAVEPAVPDAGAARVVFANGPDSVEWALAS